MRFALVLALAPGPEPTPASAPADPFALHWDAPAQCPDEAAVRAAIERHLGGPLASPRGDGLRVDALARERDDERWDVELVVETAEGRSERTIRDAPDCATATETSALVIAIAIDPDVALRDPATVPTPAEPETPTVATPTPVVTREPPPSPPPGPPPLRWRAAVGARADVTVGAHPRVGFGGTVFVDVLAGTRARFGLGASISGGPTLAVDDASVRMLRWTIEARGCPVFGVRRWLEIVPCVGIQAGQTRVDTRGLVDERDPRDPWLAPTLQVATVFVPLPALGIWVGAHGLVPVFRRAYEVVGRGVVHRTAPVAGGALVGIEARFP
jgi:hypothetical protein